MFLSAEKKNVLIESCNKYILSIKCPSTWEQCQKQFEKIVESDKENDENMKI